MDFLRYQGRDDVLIDGTPVLPKVISPKKMPKEAFTPLMMIRSKMTVKETVTIRSKRKASSGEGTSSSASAAVDEGVEEGGEET